MPEVALRRGKPCGVQLQILEKSEKAPSIHTCDVIAGGGGGSGRVVGQRHLGAAVGTVLRGQAGGRVPRVVAADPRQLARNGGERREQVEHHVRYDDVVVDGDEPRDRHHRQAETCARGGIRPQVKA